MLSLIVIFSAKVIEVSLTTLRMVFLSKGEKLYASTIGLFEIVIWLQVASAVLGDINEHPAKMVVYALGFSVGSYVGLFIEERIGLGYSNVQVITTPEEGEKLADSLRELGHAVTVINGRGRDNGRDILSTYVKRKKQDEIIQCVKGLGINGVVTVSETQKIDGGYGIK